MKEVAAGSHSKQEGFEDEKMWKFEDLIMIMSRGQQEVLWSLTRISQPETRNIF